jgi:hypothetical protein
MAVGAVIATRSIRPVGARRDNVQPRETVPRTRTPASDPWPRPGPHAFKFKQSLRFALRRTPGSGQPGLPHSDHHGVSRPLRPASSSDTGVCPSPSPSPRDTRTDRAGEVRIRVGDWLRDLSWALPGSGSAGRSMFAVKCQPDSRDSLRSPTDSSKPLPMPG